MGINAKCVIDGCNNKPLMLIFGQWVCGNCVLEWHKKIEDMKRKEFEEVLKL